MASNQTANYRLSQWEAEDAVRRVDFNADNAKIDAALKAVDQRVDGLTQAVAGKASQSALSSEASTRSAAVAALNAAVARRGNCQIETSAYTGNGEQFRTLSFPAVPKLIILIANQRLALITQDNSVNFYINNGLSFNTVITSWNGSQLTFSVNGPVHYLNTSGWAYTVIAFYDMS